MIIPLVITPLGFYIMNFEVNMSSGCIDANSKEGFEYFKKWLIEFNICEFQEIQKS
jgi:hypothetical protein